METESKEISSANKIIIQIIFYGVVAFITYKLFNGSTDEPIKTRSDADLRSQCRESFRGTTLYSNSDAIDACVKNMKAVVPDLEKYCSTHRC